MTPAGKNWLIAGLVLIVLTGIFFGGYFTYSKTHSCLVSYDTTYVHDTVTHTIINKVPYYVQKLDTVIVSDTILTKIDTAMILDAYFATYQYTRTFEDSLLKATLEDRVTQNKPAVISFEYVIKQPQQIIQNIDKSVTYQSYIYLGGSVPVMGDVKNAEFGVFGAFRRGFGGIEYNPAQKSLSLTAGFKIIQFK